MASLSVKTIDGKRHVAGTITNRGERPLANVRIRLIDGIARIDGTPIAAGEAREISAPIDPADRSLDMPSAESYFNERRSTTIPIATPDYTSLESFAFQRSMRATHLLAEGNRAGITGTPAVFVNGIELEGGAVSYEEATQAIQRELARASR